MANSVPLFKKGEAFIPANCLSSDAVGDCVYITGTRVAGLYQTSKVDIFDDAKMPSIGFIVEKSTSTRCTVQIDGVADGVYSGLTPNKPLVIGADSRLTHVAPAAGSDPFVLIQYMGVAFDTNVVRIKPILPIIRRLP